MSPLHKGVAFDTHTSQASIQLKIHNAAKRFPLKVEAGAAGRVDVK